MDMPFDAKRMIFGGLEVLRHCHGRRVTLGCWWQIP